MLLRRCAPAGRSLRPHGLLPAASLAARPFLRPTTPKGPRDRPGPPISRYADKRVIGFTQEQLFEVVADVAKYAEFVPFCSRSVVTKRDGDGDFEAELTIEFFKIAERYTSRVRAQRPAHVRAAAVRSELFSHLSSDWKFSPGPTPGSCLLEFSVEFAVAHPLYAPVIDRVLPEVAGQQVKAFQDRCARLYGLPAAVPREAQPDAPL